MQRYKIVKPVVLDFDTGRDQYTVTFESGFVDWDGKEKSFYEKLDGSKRQETINWGWVIRQYVEDGSLIAL